MMDDESRRLYVGTSERRNDQSELSTYIHSFALSSLCGHPWLTFCIDRSVANQASQTHTQVVAVVIPFLSL